MVKDLDITLRDFLKGEAESGSELDSAQVNFAVPKESWQSTGMGLFLNIYLYNIKVNWDLRSNKITRTYTDDGKVIKEKAPPRVDCTFLITAWDKATEATDEEKVQQEHRLLSQVLEILLTNPKIPPDYLRGNLVGQAPDLPIQIPQHEELNSMVEFWSALNSPLRPFINCRITVSMNSPKVNAPVPVAVAKTTSFHTSDGKAPEQWVQVFGRVTDNQSSGIEGALVKINNTSKSTTTDSDGYFTFFRLTPGEYEFFVNASGYNIKTISFNVPPSEGERYLIVLDSL